MDPPCITLLHATFTCPKDYDVSKQTYLRPKEFFVLILVNNYSKAKCLKSHTIMHSPICFLYACSKMMGTSCDLSWFCLLVQNPFWPGRSKCRHLFAFLLYKINSCTFGTIDRQRVHIDIASKPVLCI